MDTTSFISTLTQAKQGNTQAQELLIHKFLPLIRKYAYKCHAMEFENAQQELIFALLAAVHSITYIQNEGECIPLSSERNIKLFQISLSYFYTPQGI